MTKSLSDYDASIASLGQPKPRNIDPKTGTLKIGRPKIPHGGPDDTTAIQRYRARQKAAKAGAQRAQHRSLATAMRILAVSDIHDNVACVRKLRAQEDNRFDAIAIAGDIGGHRADEIFEILKSFSCPIVYIDGNHDDRSATRSAALDSGCHLAHLNIVRIGPLNFTGFSFVEPTAQLTDAEHSQLCQSNLLEQFVAANVDPSCTVLIAHDRVGRLSERFPNLLLHLYGHRDPFNVRQEGSTTYVNSSALDRIRPVIPKSLTPEAASYADIRHTNLGNYAVIEVGREGDIAVECRLLRRQHANWTPVNAFIGGRYGGPLLIDEEACFGDNVRKRASNGG
jgi:hypothetical protein